MYLCILCMHVKGNRLQLMYCVLCIVYCVLCIVYYVLCIMYYACSQGKNSLVKKLKRERQKRKAERSFLDVYITRIWMHGENRSIRI